MTYLMHRILVNCSHETRLRKSQIVPQAVLEHRFPSAISDSMLTE